MTSHPSIIFKIVTRDAWATAVEAGHFDGAPIDLADGYIHFSIIAICFWPSEESWTLQLVTLNSKPIYLNFKVLNFIHFHSCYHGRIVRRSNIFETARNRRWRKSSNEARFAKKEKLEQETLVIHKDQHLISIIRKEYLN